MLAAAAALPFPLVDLVVQGAAAQAPVAVVELQELQILVVVAEENGREALVEMVDQEL